MKIRFKFRKQGDLRFIGHLDVMRYFQKVFRRAELDMAFTGGYSPHIIMTFASPLGLGLTSDGEYMDAEFETCPGKEELIARMNAVCVPDLTVTDACLLPEKSKNAMASLAEADYTVRFRNKETDGRAFFERLGNWLRKEEILIERKTKKNTRSIDIRPMIKAFSVTEDAVSLRLSQGSENNLKPETILEVFLRGNEGALPDSAALSKPMEEIGETDIRILFAINRDELYTTEEGRTFSLLDAGERDF